ncbi:hypothetical protein F4780DRAFT_185715 [Xylariomycetidae sp. FL0641]|nr:hypothetical protein F4780DRAFT_185715 [Xylariomycetidae sp. FL0641]
MAWRQLIRALYCTSLLFPCFARPALGGQYRYDEAGLGLRKRDLSQSVTVGSLPLVDGKPPLRLEVRELQKDEDQWNLYILALSWMQYTDLGSPFSWYQIAGIHGAPGSTWGDVEATPGNDGAGYCRHVSILFPTWHRPYLALYEQVLYNIVQYIALMYPADQLDRIQSAAKAFRVPYWDWATSPPEGDSLLPNCVGGSATIEISGPNGRQNISNPLFSYTFKAQNYTTFADTPYNIWNETKRAPNPSTDPAAVSNNTFVAHSLDTHLPTIQQRLYNLFANYGNYTTFSNEEWIPVGNDGSDDSVESLHDTIHILGGGGWGHLSIIAYSSFDPLFFLHHANLDRIFAMWQVVHNDTYVVPTPALYASHTTDNNQIEDAQTPLTPFFSNETAFWTSDMVRDHKVFGYTYAEVATNNRTDVITAINRLYTQYTPATMTVQQRKKPESAHQMSAMGGKLWKTPGMSWNRLVSDHPPVEAIFEDGAYREWVANIRVNKHALNSSFSVHLFLGSPPPDSTDWPTSPNLIGSLGIFAGNDRSGRMQHGIVSGTIPLTSALVNAVATSRVATLSVEDVEPLLMSNLTMRVSLVDGTMVDPRDVRGLGVNVISSSVTAPKSEDTLAHWSDVETHFDLFP